MITELKDPTKHIVNDVSEDVFFGEWPLLLFQVNRLHLDALLSSPLQHHCASVLVVFN